MFLKSSIAILPLWTTSTFALNNTAVGFTPWGRPRLAIPQAECSTSCSLTNSTTCQPCSPLTNTSTPTNPLDPQSFLSDPNLSPDLRSTASLLIADGVPLPPLSELQQLTDTLSLLKSVGLEIPPSNDSPVGFSLDGKSNTELEHMLKVLELHVKDMPPLEEEVKKDDEAGGDIGFADILAILMAAEDRDAEKNAANKEQGGKMDSRAEEGDEGEMSIEELWVNDPAAAHERLAPLLESKDTSKEGDDTEGAAISGRIDIVGTRINITEHKGPDGDKKWVSVNKSNDTGDNTKVIINGQEHP